MIVAKQPNGKYYIYDGKKSYINQTEEDYYALVIEKEKEKWQNDNFFHGYDCIVKYCYDDAALKQMGFEQSRRELLKFVPEYVKDQSYSSCNFATYGKCPSCGKNVEYGMGKKDEICPGCGQRLTWEERYV